MLVNTLLIDLALSTRNMLPFRVAFINLLSQGRMCTRETGVLKCFISQKVSAEGALNGLGLV